MNPLDESIIAALRTDYALSESRQWRMLLRRLELNQGFTFHTVIAPDVYGVEIARRTLEEWAKGKGMRFHVITVKESEPPETLTLTLLEHLPADIGLVWVQADGPSPGSHPDPFIKAVWHPVAAILNSRRNLLQRGLPIPLILAGPEPLQVMLREHAPDLWSVRASVTYLDSPGRSLETEVNESQFNDSTSISGDPDFTLAEAAKLEGKPEQSLQLASLLFRAGLQYRNKQQWSNAERCLSRAWQLREEFHAVPEERWETLNQLGILFEDLGDYLRAAYYYQQAYEQALIAFGSEHPDSLGSRSNLANALFDQGKNAEAEAEHQAVLKTRHRLLGAEHPDTLASRSNLANVFYKQGKFAEAETEGRIVLEALNRVYDAEDPHILNIRGNLANALFAQGKHAESEVESRAVLAAQQRVLGEDHPSVCRSCYNLALCLTSQGKLKEALALMQRAEKGWHKVFGGDHPDAKHAKLSRERIEARLQKTENNDS
ncbi:MAG: tetratricopeptide repeat protein [Prosthecobacter sp.]|uniref:tetratricopeptide repeat protein n=1 Tax=Prosthecobacter sp. TaxID=1965333 RepID=UPI003BB1CFCE